MPDFRSGLFSSLQFRLALGFVLALGLALALIGVAAGVVADKQTERFERDISLAQEARVRQFVSNYYAGQRAWARDDPRLQESVERIARVAGSRIVVYDSAGRVLADSHPSLPTASPSQGQKGKGRDWKGVRKFPILYGEREVGAFALSDTGTGGAEYATRQPQESRRWSTARYSGPESVRRRWAP